MGFCGSGMIPAAPRETINFNPDWRFTKSDPAGAAAVQFDDRTWTNISAPHTFNDTDTFDDSSLSGHRGEQNQWSGRTWYRKTFLVPDQFKGHKVFIEFEAVRQVAEVYCNGEWLGTCKTGFTPFGFDLTPHLQFGRTNLIAVMCDNRFMRDPYAADGGGGKLAALAAKFNAEIPEDVAQIQADQLPWNNPHWHPAHGGIYRNVRLQVTAPLHVSLPLYSFLQTAGPYVYATAVSGTSATVHLQLPIQNEGGTAATVEAVCRVLDPEGRPRLTLRPARVEIAAGKSVALEFQGELAQPKLWEPGYPAQYRWVCELRAGDEVVDSCEIPFGIRTLRWEAQTGCYLNGQHLKLHGWGQKPTDEWPGLGAAQPDWMHFFTLELMHEAGGNFVRWGHCAGGPASIASCDRLGLLVDQPGVDGESDTRGAAWRIRADAFRDVVIYYRNHPSIVIWEGGNQKVTREHAQELRGIVEKYDPRGGRAYAHRRADGITGEVMDVGIGTEGGREMARLPVVEGEYDREESPRRIWDDASPPSFGYPEARGQTYNLTSEQYAVNQVAQYLKKLGAPDHCGGANWIFSDSTSGGRVGCEVARTGGEVDGVRLPKEAYAVCRVMFRADPQVHIIGHWSYPAGTKKNIHVAANGDAVELFVNGAPLGRGRRTERYLFTFPNVEWRPGELKAVSYRRTQPVATHSLFTVGPAIALRLIPRVGPAGWRADGSDVALVDVEAVDERGNRCPTFAERVDFACSGPATWRGGYNSGKTNSINQPSLDLECGINRVALRATRHPGVVTVQATARGLRPAVLTLTARAVSERLGFIAELPELPVVNLPASGPDAAFADTMPPNPAAPAPRGDGRFIEALSYSGPTAAVGVATNAQDGLKVYVDREFTFQNLPPALQGADFVQAAAADSAYSAVDLMQLAVKVPVTVSIAHDDRLPRPAWLTRQFTATELSLDIDGHAMKLFQHRSPGNESLTLGSNCDTPGPHSGLMYLVLVHP